jgi:hypothetical protein
MNKQFPVWPILTTLAVLLISITAMTLPKGSTIRENIETVAVRTIQAIGESNLSEFIIRSLSQDNNNQDPRIVQQAVAVNDYGLLAYTDKLVYQSGQIPKLFVRASQDYSVKIFIIENGAVKLLSQKRTQQSRKLGHIVFNTFTGFSNSDFDVVELDLVNRSGWHQAEVISGARKSYVPFFVEKLNNHKVLFVESTDTLKAYVSANDMRTYYTPSKPKLIGVFSRPLGYPINYKIKLYNSAPNDVDCTDGLINADFVLKAGLDQLSISYDVVSDEFLDNLDNLKRYRMIVLGAHNEYWTSKKVENIKAYAYRGGSLLILGGNTAWRWVARLSSMEVFWGDGVLKDDERYESFLTSTLGSYYDPTGYDTYAPFQLVDGMHLLQDSQKITNLFGVGTKFERCKDRISGASGHETDRLFKKSQGFSVIAKGLNKGGSSGAQIVYKRFGNEGRGQVLNFGSISLWHRIDDPVIQSLIRNFYRESKKQSN